MDWCNVEGKLYDKNDQIDQLRQVYQRQNRRNTAPVQDSLESQNHKNELVLITGPSGVGKTALALTLQEQVEQQEGYFVRGKFEQPTNFGTSAAPCCQVDCAGHHHHGAFASALSQYATLLLARCNNAGNIVSERASGDEIASLKNALERELDTSELQVLVESIPALQPLVSHIITPNYSNSTAVTSNHSNDGGWRGLQGTDAEKRYHHIFSKFVGAIRIASDHHPFILLIDDLQWADASSLELLKMIMTRHIDATGLLLLCTLRSDDHHSTDGLSVTAAQALVDELHESGVTTTQIPVPNMSEEAVHLLVSDLLHHSTEHQSLEISKTIYRTTDGNAFFIFQLLNFLEGEGRLDSAYQLEETMVADASNINQNPTVLDFVAKKIQQLPTNVQDVLKMAACMGTTVSEHLLNEAGSVGLSPLQVKPALLVAHEQRLVIYDQSSGAVSFVHDVIQQAAYSLILENTRARLHLHIGRALWVWLAYNELETHIFLVTNQITRGLHLVDDDVEKEEMAELFYRAGQKAAQTSSFTQASDYFKTGISLLGQSQWKRLYRLSLNLYNAAAEAEYYAGNLARVDSLLSTILKHATSLDDKLVARYTQIYSLASRDDVNQTFSIGFEVLKQLGVAFPHRLRTIRTRLAWRNCLRKLHQLSDDDIMRLPVMQDNRQLIVMRLLNTLMMSAFSARQELVAPILIRMVNRTLQHGICGASCIGLGYLGSHLGRQGRAEDGLRFVRLGLRIMERFEAKEWQSRLALGVYSGFYTMRHPIREAIKPLLASRRAGLVVGDIHSSAACASLQCQISLYAAMPLPELLEDLRRCRKMCVQYGQNSEEIVLSHQETLCLNFMGVNSLNPVTFTGEDVEDLRSKPSGAPSKQLVSTAWMLLLKHMCSVYFNEFQDAKTIAGRFRAMGTEVAILELSLVTHLFLEGLTAAVLSRTVKSERRRALKIWKQLRSYQSISSANVANKVCLLEAEISAADNDQQAALSKYDLSIEAARKEGFLHEQALACERAGEALIHWGSDARDYLEQAYSLYQQWGALAKLQQLQRRWNAVFGATGR